MSLHINDAQPSANEGPLQDDPPAGKFSDVAASIGAKNLIIAIVTMPFVFMLVIAAIITVFGRPGDDAGYDADVAAVHTEASLEQERLQAGTIHADGALRAFDHNADMALDGDRLAVRLETPEGAIIVIYDLATKRVTDRISVSALGADTK